VLQSTKVAASMLQSTTVLTFMVGFAVMNLLSMFLVVGIEENGCCDRDAVVHAM